MRISWRFDVAVDDPPRVRFVESVGRCITIRPRRTAAGAGGESDKLTFPRFHHAKRRPLLPLVRAAMFASAADAARASLGDAAALGIGLERRGKNGAHRAARRGSSPRYTHHAARAGGFADT